MSSRLSQRYDPIVSPCMTPIYLSLIKTITVILIISLIWKLNSIFPKFLCPPLSRVRPVPYTVSQYHPPDLKRALNPQLPTYPRVTRLLFLFLEGCLPCCTRFHVSVSTRCRLFSTDTELGFSAGTLLIRPLVPTPEGPYLFRV